VSNPSRCRSTPLSHIAGEIRAHLRAIPLSRATTRTEITTQVLSSLLSALGGRENIREIEAVASSRLRMKVANATAVDERAIRSLGLRGIARPTGEHVHVIVGPGAGEALALLRALVAS
jgi:PTS system N-acetylglucosamine-specific IIC component